MYRLLFIARQLGRKKLIAGVLIISLITTSSFFLYTNLHHNSKAVDLIEELSTLLEPEYKSLAVSACAPGHTGCTSDFIVNPILDKLQESIKIQADVCLDPFLTGLNSNYIDGAAPITDLPTTIPDGNGCTGYKLTSTGVDPNIITPESASNPIKVFTLTFHVTTSQFPNANSTGKLADYNPEIGRQAASQSITSKGSESADINTQIYFYNSGDPSSITFQRNPNGGAADKVPIFWYAADANNNQLTPYTISNFKGQYSGALHLEIHNTEDRWRDSDTEAYRTQGISLMNVLRGDAAINLLNTSTDISGSKSTFGLRRVDGIIDGTINMSWDTASGTTSANVKSVNLCPTSCVFTQSEMKSVYASRSFNTDAAGSVITTQPNSHFATPGFIQGFSRLDEIITGKIIADANGNLTWDAGTEVRHNSTNVNNETFNEIKKPSGSISYKNTVAAKTVTATGVLYPFINVSQQALDMRENSSIQTQTQTYNSDESKLNSSGTSRESLAQRAKVNTSGTLSNSAYGNLKEDFQYLEGTHTYEASNNPYVGCKSRSIVSHPTLNTNLASMARGYTVSDDTSDCTAGFGGPNPNGLKGQNDTFMGSAWAGYIAAANTDINNSLAATTGFTSAYVMPSWRFMSPINYSSANDQGANYHKEIFDLPGLTGTSSAPQVTLSTYATILPAHIAFITLPRKNTDLATQGALSSLKSTIDNFLNDLSSVKPEIDIKRLTYSTPNMLTSALGMQPANTWVIILGEGTENGLITGVATATYSSIYAAAQTADVALSIYNQKDLPQAITSPSSTSSSTSISRTSYLLGEHAYAQETASPPVYRPGLTYTATQALRTTLNSASSKLQNLLQNKINPKVQEYVSRYTKLIPQNIPRYLKDDSYKNSIPVLMYHSIYADDAALAASHDSAGVTKANFENQMQYLKDHNIETLNFQDFKYYIDQAQIGNTIVNGRRRLLITFDDGYENFELNAWPAMKRLGMSGVVFVSTKFMNPHDKIKYPNAAEPVDIEKYSQHLNWQTMRDIENYTSDNNAHYPRVTFQSHTVTHCNLINLDSMKNPESGPCNPLDPSINVNDEIQNARYKLLLELDDGHIDPATKKRVRGAPREAIAYPQGGGWASYSSHNTPNYIQTMAKKAYKYGFSTKNESVTYASATNQDGKGGPMFLSRYAVANRPWQE